MSAAMTRDEVLRIVREAQGRGERPNLRGANLSEANLNRGQPERGQPALGQPDLGQPVRGQPVWADLWGPT